MPVYMINKVQILHATVNLYKTQLIMSSLSFSWQQHGTVLVSIAALVKCMAHKSGIVLQCLSQQQPCLNVW